ncbi:alpha/beta hydrolase family protein [Actinocorallia longicatena]|uniref:Tannase/feruloyl esterase family alpha/beta hydrolase n=1 Tax=Actinocorallia longicatena TaxID=111803 RepID=A0ABP6QF16_9ACTN
MIRPTLSRPTIRKVLTAAFLLGAAVGLPAAPAAAAGCPDALRVPGAELQVSACLADLTTAGTLASGHTVQADWAGLTPAGAQNPSGVPGIQLDGYFPDTSATNTHHGWNHDAQFVIRLPEHWNGGLVVAGTPGVRRQYANDFAISDWVLAKGYAYAATDKGNTGAAFHTDGAEPGDAIAEWNDRVTQLTRAARETLRLRYGRTPARTFTAGISNGGYLVRWQLERHPELYTGGVDWEGTLWTPEGPNLLRFLPTALAGRPEEVYPADSAPLWDYHRQVYWGLTQSIYRQELDPGYTGDEAAYDYATRPRSVVRAVRKISLSGRISRPMITLHGTLDALLPIDQDSDAYSRMIENEGRGRFHRYYRLEGGNHVDGLYDAFPSLLRPILPCFRTAFDAVEQWTATGHRPPPSATLTRPSTGDLATTCALENR